MSLAQKAARGAAWTILFGLTARVIGVAGTLAMTHLVAPEVIGEAAAATIVVMLFSWISNWGFGQYLVVKGRGDQQAEVVWHCTVAHVVLGGGAMVLVGFVGGAMMPWFDAPGAAQYVPGMAVAFALRRLASVPEKLLMQRMRFRAIGISMALSETLFAVTSVLLAWRGHGGMSVVYGNIVQGAVMVLVLVAAVGVRSWITPTRLRAQRFREMARFGFPLAIESVAHNASRYCDNLLMSRYFGPGPMAFYNLGYNLADIPATYVGEQISQVMLPSLAELPHERRAAALERSAALLGLIIFPMAIGLGVIADSLIGVALAPAWQEVAPLLTILAVLAVFRPITWIIGSYLEATEQTSGFMYLELGKLVVLFGGIAILQRWGIQAAACAVGVAFGFNALAGIYLVSHGPKPCPSPAKLIIGFLRPALACAIMAGAVLGARHGLIAAGVTDQRILLPVEIVVGALTYVPSAFLVARPIARDFIKVLRSLRDREPPASSS